MFVLNFIFGLQCLQKTRLGVQIEEVDAFSYIQQEDYAQEKFGE